MPEILEIGKERRTRLFRERNLGRLSRRYYRHHRWSQAAIVVPVLAGGLYAQGVPFETHDHGYYPGFSQQLSGDQQTAYERRATSNSQFGSVPLLALNVIDYQSKSEIDDCAPVVRLDSQRTACIGSLPHHEKLHYYLVFGDKKRRQLVQEVASEEITVTEGGMGPTAISSPLSFWPGRSGSYPRGDETLYQLQTSDIPESVQ